MVVEIVFGTAFGVPDQLRRGFSKRFCIREGLVFNPTKRSKNNIRPVWICPISQAPQIWIHLRASI